MLGSYRDAPRSCVTESQLLYTHYALLSSPLFVRVAAVAIREKQDLLLLLPTQKRYRLEKNPHVSCVKAHLLSRANKGKQKLELLTHS